MSKTIKELAVICLATLLITFLVWLPHLLQVNFYSLDFSQGFSTIYRNFDGTEYITIAKTLYNPEETSKIPQTLPANYFASHFPGYSLLILLFAPLLGFLKSMLFVSLLSTIGSAIIFYLLVKNFHLTSQPLWLTLIFLILPARWLVVHSIGSSEPLFIFFILLCFYFLMKFEQTGRWLNIHLAGVFGLFAQLTRPPGILLFVALTLFLLWKILQAGEGSLGKRLLKTIYLYHPLILIPTGLLIIFYWFSFSYGDFFAYFHSGDNIHLTFPPFQVFNKGQVWVGDIWLEDIVYIFILGFLGAILLLKQKLFILGFFVLTYLTASIFVAHRDISRYLLPVFPFLLIAFEKILINREFRIVLIIAGLGIFLYAQNFILGNSAPIPNLESFD